MKLTFCKHVQATVRPAAVVEGTSAGSMRISMHMSSCGARCTDIAALIHPDCPAVEQTLLLLAPPLPLQRWMALRATPASSWWRPPTAPTSWTMRCCAPAASIARWVLRCRCCAAAGEHRMSSWVCSQRGCHGCCWDGGEVPPCSPALLAACSTLNALTTHPALLSLRVCRCLWTPPTRRAAWTSSRWGAGLLTLYHLVIASTQPHLPTQGQLLWV